MLTRGAKLLRQASLIMHSSSSSNSGSRSRPLAEVGLGTNEFTKILLAENADPQDQFKQREVHHVHYTTVFPEKVPAPYVIGVSRRCAEALEMNLEDLESDHFANAFSGNTLLPGLDKPWASVYGCHCYGSWFGQLGDGRAMSIGEVKVRARGGEAEQRYELQLKGSGRTPYSRGFDGKAVVRSSIREFLISESMYHLGVSTTRGELLR